MANDRIKVDSVPEGVQALAAAAKADLVQRLGLPPDYVAITKLERIERLESEEEALLHFGIGRDELPDYRFYFLAKGVQYVYETQHGRAPVLVEEQFVV